MQSRFAKGSLNALPERTHERHGIKSKSMWDFNLREKL